MNSVLEIPVARGEVALIDERDADLVASRSWCALRVDGQVYASSSWDRLAHKKSPVLMHRLILGVADRTQQIDHANRNGLDNRRVNLRLASPSQNASNQRLRADNSSGYKGVAWHPRTQKWRAYAGSGPGRHLGYFNDPWEAAQAYNTAALSLSGEFAYLNTQKS